jgi:hypothetical protein
MLRFVDCLASSREAESHIATWAVYRLVVVVGLVMY